MNNQTSVAGTVQDLNVNFYINKTSSVKFAYYSW